MSLINILVAEDDADDRSLLSEAFTEIGISRMVKMCNNGREVFEYLDKTVDPDLLPGLIILDAKMPVMDGLETLSSLKANPRYDSIPVVMLSAVEDVDFQRQCVEQGARSYVVKPRSFDANLALYLYDMLRHVNSEIDIETMAVAC